MPIDFHAETNRTTYATREADATWQQAITSIVDPRGKRIVDVGCGGGIYTQAWSQLGVATVQGIDFSAPILATAATRQRVLTNVTFQQGEAGATGLPSGAPASTRPTAGRLTAGRLYDPDDAQLVGDTPNVSTLCRTGRGSQAVHRALPSPRAD